MMDEEDLTDDGIVASSDEERMMRMNVAGRVGHGAVLRGSRLVMWGGYTRLQRLKQGFLVINMETGRKELMQPVLGDESVAGVVMRDEHRRRFATCYSASAFAVQGNYLYTFGGHSLVTNLAVNFFFRFEFCQETRPQDQPMSWVDEVRVGRRNEYVKWKILDACTEMRSDRPSPRDKHALFIYDHKAYSFGGFGPSMFVGYLHNSGDWRPNMDEGDDRGWNNQFLVYDFLVGCWQNPTTTGSVPCPRAAHAMCLVGSKAYLFGGRSEPCRLNDLYHLDLPTLQWTTISPGGELPCPRSWASLTHLDDNHLLVFGGMDNSRRVVGDGFILDLKEQRMRRVVDSEADTRRLWHVTLLTDDNRVIVVGGCCTSIYSSNPVYADNFLQLRLHEPSSLYATCLRHCTKAIDSYSPAQLSHLNHFIGLDILNRGNMRQRSSYSTAGV